MVPVTRFCFLAALSSLAIVVSGCTTVSQKLTSMTRGPILRPSAPADSCGVEDCDTASSGAAGNSMQGYAAGSNCRVDSKGRRIQATPCHFEACMVPRELRKTALPEYRVEPPDVLLIEAVNNLRPAQSPILAGEPLIIQVDGTIPLTPGAPKVKQQFKTIDGTYIIGTDGYVNLGTGIWSGSLCRTAAARNPAKDRHSPPPDPEEPSGPCHTPEPLDQADCCRASPCPNGWNRWPWSLRQCVCRGHDTHRNKAGHRAAPELSHARPRSVG